VPLVPVTPGPKRTSLRHSCCSCNLTAVHSPTVPRNAHAVPHNNWDAYTDCCIAMWRPTRPKHTATNSATSGVACSAASCALVSKQHRQQRKTHMCTVTGELTALASLRALCFAKCNTGNKPLQSPASRLIAPAHGQQLCKRAS
jgi:hypothetical protein